MCERAAEWFEKAALQGNAEAMYSLAKLYLEGKGVPENIERAVRLWKKAPCRGI